MKVIILTLLGGLLGSVLNEFLGFPTHNLTLFLAATLVVMGAVATYLIKKRYTRLEKTMIYSMAVIITIQNCAVCLGFAGVPLLWEIFDGLVGSFIGIHALKHYNKEQWKV